MRANNARVYFKFFSIKNAIFIKNYKKINSYDRG